MQARTPRFILSLALFAAAASLGPAAYAADWRDEATSFDLVRIQNLQQSRALGIAEAEQGGGTGDSSAISETLSPAGHTVPESVLLGNWRCRQMKLGGVTPYIVYGWFSCRITHADGGLFFEKLTGTQRTEGFLYPENGAWIYLGALSETDEPPHRYSGNQASAGASATPDDQIGLLTGIGDNRLRIELPAPLQESDFDAIELER